MIAYQDATVTLHAGDCLDVLRELPDASVHAIVTDPPYGLGFMGREWDALPPGLPWAQECLRVLKPGGHLLAFGGTRTWHRLACAVEDAGFEVRDSIAWLYGSGFPKSLDVSKAIDKAAGATREVVGMYVAPDGNGRDAQRMPTNLPSGQGWMVNTGERQDHAITAPATPDAERWQGWGTALKPGHEPVVVARKPLTEETTQCQTEKQSPKQSGTPSKDTANQSSGNTTTPETSGTPQQTPSSPLGNDPAAFEPVVVARKPLVGTVAANVLAHGTGALNIDGCRVGTTDSLDGGGSGTGHVGAYLLGGYPDLAALREGAVSDEVTPDGKNRARAVLARALTTDNARLSSERGGRWPANVVLDESHAAALDAQSGTQRDGVAVKRNGRTEAAEGWGNIGKAQVGTPDATYGGAGGASRFFYTAKAATDERVRVDGIAHPTVKPLALMRWLVRLVTPPGGTVLEPFAGSGTTVEACILEGFKCVAIEREADYLPLIVQRINRRRDPVQAVKDSGEDSGLFELIP